jgi:predicted transposase/invertase (TIGR01784 family)
MRFLSPKTDFAFKKIFGSIESKNILMSFLNAIVYEEKKVIQDLEIINPYSPSKVVSLKETFLDVKATLDSGKIVIIEMQVARVDAFEKRIVYNLAKAYANQLKSGEEYYKLNEVIALTITDFVLFKETEKIINKFVFKEKSENFIYPKDNVEMVFVELPKFKLTLEELESLSDKWIYFLKNASSLEIIPPKLEEIGELNEALNLANEGNLTFEELQEMEAKQTKERDDLGRLTQARKEAKAKGIELGKKEREKEIAINLLKTGMNIEQVASITDLSLEIIQSLINKKGD